MTSKINETINKTKVSIDNGIESIKKEIKKTVVKRKKRVKKVVPPPPPPPPP